MIRPLLAVVCISLAILPATLAAQDAAPRPAVKDPRLDRNTPEGTLRVFLLGVTSANAALVKATVSPLPEDDQKLLLIKIQGDQRKFNELKERFAAMKIRRLRAGDKFKLPGGKEIEVKAEEVGGDRAVLLPEESPIPFRLARSDGYWWVNAAPVVAARKAALALRKLVDSEMAGLEGGWDIVSMETRGAPAPPGAAPQKAVFHEGKATFSFPAKSGTAPWQMRLDLDPRPKVKLVDLVRDSGERLPCIYERSGDDLKIAMPLVPTERQPGDALPRPESFDSKDRPVIVIAAKRAK